MTKKLASLRLIPAHDEEAGIAATLESVAGQKLPADNIIVYAHLLRSA
jgi:hypothetical protein